MLARGARRTSLLVAAVLIALAAPAMAQGPTFVQERSNHDFNRTVSALKRSVSRNGFMVMGHLNQARVLSMTGLHLAGAQTFLVGNPTVGKKVFAMNPAAGAVLPVRVYVWQQGDTVYVGYFKPSEELAGISGKLAMPGAMLDKKLAAISQGATQ